MLASGHSDFFATKERMELKEKLFSVFFACPP
jgi:hypothetical protein